MIILIELRSLDLNKESFISDRHQMKIIIKTLMYLADSVLKRLCHSSPWFRIQFLFLELTDKVFHGSFCTRNSLIDFLHCLRISNSITDSNGKTILQKPVVDQPLSMTEKLPSCIRTNLFPLNQEKKNVNKPRSTLQYLDVKFLVSGEQDAATYQITCTRLPLPVPRVFLQRVPARSSPLSILTWVSPGVMYPVSAFECQAEYLNRFICFGMIRLKTCLPGQRGRGFRIAGAGTFPSKSCHHISVFMNTSCTWKRYQQRN